MNIKDTGHHFIAVFGSAVAGSEAAYQLSKRGFRVVVFDQGMLPYGKIEDGLPMWHWKLRNKEEQNIDHKLDHPNILFVPGVKLGRDLGFQEVIDWGFTAVILATGAWKDRPLPIEDINMYINKGLIYQNPFIHWFNHHHEPGYIGEQVEIEDNAIVIGGGLASLDVVKVLMIKTVQRALAKKGIQVDLFTLEHGINKILEKHQLTLQELDVSGSTLYYRRRAIDMPLSPMPADTPENLIKAQLVRQKILDNYQKKYLFKFEECCIPVNKIIEGGKLRGIKFQRTKIDGQKILPVNEFFEKKTNLVISSIGSIPEKIPGVPSNGNIFKISNPESCQIDGFNNVFAIGNAVTGRGNISESMKHSRDISESIMDDYLDWHQQDYEKWHRQTAVKVTQDISRIIDVIKKQQFLPDHVIKNIMNKTFALQKKVGYNGDYRLWIQRHIPPRLEDMLS